MTLLEHALKLANMGFHIFPAQPKSKLPAIKDFPTLATPDHKQIKTWWSNGHTNSNIGISTTCFKESEALLVVDVDQKEGKMGENELFRLELEGYDFPATLETITPSGGRHLFYKTREPVKQGVNVLAPGLDIRSRGGYVIGPGSVLDNGAYVLRDGKISEAPEWLVSRCGRPNSKPDLKIETTHSVDRTNAISRARFYLENEAPFAIQGSAGDQTTFRVAARIKDFGINALDCYTLMVGTWNSKCSPPWSEIELLRKIKNAYRYGERPQGVDAPETIFKKIESDDEQEKLSPVQKLNKEFAFVVAGGGAHILWETTGPEGENRVEHLDIATFHQKLAAQTIFYGDKQKKISQLWIGSNERRSYDGICFMPGKKTPPRFYNLWRGFAVEPYPKNFSQEAEDAVDMFLDHAKANICQNDEKLFNWLMSYFAQLVQKPWEKPHSSIVFKGGKGIGKNFFIEQIGELLGSHYTLASDKRYLLSNFNGHLENCLLFVLDEAFWSGDKQAEGVLKNLITGKKHVIEHKGKEPYTVNNCTRVVIIGNEEWVVPASQDERRYAVFNVGEGRRQDWGYFSKISKGMRDGGHSLLLSYLLTFECEDFNLNDPPKTAGLLEQKISSLDKVHAWWFDCLSAGEVVGSDFGGVWPSEITKSQLWEGFRRYSRDRNFGKWAPSNRSLGKTLKKCLPSLDNMSKQTVDGIRVNSYKLPPLSECRAAWDVFIGHPGDWVI